MDELIELGRNKEWLLLQLQTHGVADIRNVFVAEWLEEDGLHVQTFDQVSAKRNPSIAEH
jgi:uncharacterized membrane protein YcaP (DUF421 family)